MAAKIGDEFRAGDKVAQSGIYAVTHERAHTTPHEVTAITGKTFPKCRTCAQPRFKLLHKARHIDRSEFFAADPAKAKIASGKPAGADAKKAERRSA